MTLYRGKCERCGLTTLVAPVDNLPIYRRDGDGELVFVGLNTNLCEDCIRDYTDIERSPETLRIIEKIKL